MITEKEALERYRIQEANKKVVRRLFEEMITQRKLAVAEEIFAADFIWPQFGLKGPAGARAWVENFLAAFPDVDDSVVEQIADGDMVATRVRVRGTNRGPWYGLPPTNRTADFQAVGIDRLREGKIVERMAIFHVAGALQQLGHETLDLQKLAGPFGKR